MRQSFLVIWRTDMQHSGRVGELISRKCLTAADLNHGKSDQLLSFPLRPLWRCSVMSISAAEWADGCQPNFTQDETDVLVQEAEAHNRNLFITTLMKSNALLRSLMLWCYKYIALGALMRIFTSVINQMAWAVMREWWQCHTWQLCMAA